MRIVSPLLAVEVPPDAASRIIVAVFPLEALLARPSFNQRPVHREVLITHQPFRLRFDFRKEPLRQILIQHPFAVLAEHRMIPYRLVHLQAHKPAKQQVVVELLHQQPFTAHRIEHLQQQGAEQPLRRNRRTSALRVQPVKIRRHLRQHCIGHLAHTPEWVSSRNPLLQRHVAEHPSLKLIVIAAHGLETTETCERCPVLAPRRVFQQAPRIWSWKSRASTISLRPSPSMSWIWNGVSLVSRPLRGSGRPDCQRTRPSRVTAVRQLIWSKASPRMRGMFCAISMSGTRSPSRSPKRTLRPAPNFGVSNRFQSLGLGLSSRSRASSASRRAMRPRMAATSGSDALTRKAWKRAGVPARTPAFPLSI